MGWPSHLYRCSHRLHLGPLLQRELPCLARTRRLESGRLTPEDRMLPRRFHFTKPLQVAKIGPRFLFNRVGRCLLGIRQSQKTQRKTRNQEQYPGLVGFPGK